MVSEADRAIRSGKFIPDIAAGTYFHYALTENSRILAGFSAHHLNRPDESLLSTGDTARSQLPIRWTGSLMYTYANPEALGLILYPLSVISRRSIKITVGMKLQNEYNISTRRYRTNAASKT